MKRFLTTVYKLDLIFYIISGVTLALIISVTIVDVVMRNLGRPIVGTIEIISFCGSVVVGFAIPYASWKKCHVYVDFVTEKLNSKHRRIMNAITKSMGILLFAFIGFNFISYGLDLRRTHEVSPSFKIPYYPIPFGLSISSFLQCLTLISDFIKILKEESHG